MRFPTIPFMQRVFDLFKKFNFDTDGTLIKYILSNPDNTDLRYYNDIVYTTGDLATTTDDDPFETGVDAEYMKQKYSYWIEQKLGPFKDKLRADFDDGWDYLKQFDMYSTRAYMSLVDPKYPTQVVDYLETFDSATTLYDCALMESVMDSLDFDYGKDDQGDDIEWYSLQYVSDFVSRPLLYICAIDFRGGCVKLVDAMAATLDSSQINMNERVWYLDINSSSDAVYVYTAAPNFDLYKYSHVICTMPIPCLREMNLSSSFPYDLKQAIRTLHYDASVKVAMRFSSRWWEDASLGQNHKGGISATDRRTRVVVYPSYGIGGTDATMIVSYTWAQDAQRMCTFAKWKDADDPMKFTVIENILADLEDMHGLQIGTLYDLLKNIDVCDWSANQNAGGMCDVSICHSSFRSIYPLFTVQAPSLCLDRVNLSICIHRLVYI